MLPPCSLELGCWEDWASASALVPASSAAAITAVRYLSDILISWVGSDTGNSPARRRAVLIGPTAGLRRCSRIDPALSPRVQDRPVPGAAISACCLAAIGAGVMLASSFSNLACQPGTT